VVWRIKTIILDTDYAGIPDKPKENVKCIDVTFTDDSGVITDILLLDDITWRKQFEIYDEILTGLVAKGKRNLFLLKTQNNIGPFNSVQKFKGLWWKGNKGINSFKNQSEEIITNDEDHYIMAAYAKIEAFEINDLLISKNYNILCFSDHHTLYNLFHYKQDLLLKNKHVIEYLLSSGATILYLMDFGYEGSSLFMYGNESLDVEKLKQEINQILNRKQS
jgi:hypothetical protein